MAEELQPTLRPCIVDARLAFGEFGVLAVSRLIACVEVWLPTRIRTISCEGGLVSDLRVAVDYSGLRGLAGDTEQDAALVRGLRQWRRLPADDEFARMRVCFIGERPDESRLPERVRSSLRERAEWLAAGLQTRIDSHSKPWRTGQDFKECTRDTLALAAALSQLRPFILTQLEHDGQGAPALCDYAGDWLEAGVKLVSGAPALALRDELAVADLAPLEWSGVRFAVVHVILPGAPLLGRRAADQSIADVAELWAKARLFWHPLFDSREGANA